MSYREVADAHLRKLGSLIDGSGGVVPKLKRAYSDAADDLERRLAKALKSGASTMTIHQHQVLLAQCRQGLARISAEVGGKLSQSTRRVQEASANQLISSIKKMEAAAGGGEVQLPIEHAARFAGVVDRRRTSLLKLNRTSMQSYGKVAVEKVEQSLAQSLLTGDSGYAAVDRVRGAIDGEWWRAERIVRTETAWAFNATQMDATAEASKTFVDMMMRWSELVADITLVKLDNRVGDDSVAMHGQLARPGAYFVMPLSNPGLKVSQSMVGQSWTQPPNRPNDRATLTPWRPGWGWGWEYTNGRKVTRQ